MQLLCVLIESRVQMGKSRERTLVFNIPDTLKEEEKITYYSLLTDYYSEVNLKLLQF